MPEFRIHKGKQTKTSSKYHVEALGFWRSGMNRENEFSEVSAENISTVFGFIAQKIQAFPNYKKPSDIRLEVTGRFPSDMTPAFRDYIDLALQGNAYKHRVGEGITDLEKNLGLPKRA